MNTLYNLSYDLEYISEKKGLVSFGFGFWNTALKNRRFLSTNITNER